MKRCFSIMTISFFLIFVTAATAFAIPYWIEVDISSIAGSDFQLELDLFDNSEVVGDTWAFIDNVFIKGSSGVTKLIDFETGTLEGFEASLNPDSVDVVLGTWGSGSHIMRIDEDPSVTPTITWRDFLPSDATILHMEFELISDGTSGSFGQDALVASLLDPSMLIIGLTGSGDFLEATASGNSVSAEVTGINPVPEPSTFLLMGCGLLSLLGISIKRRF